MTTASGYATVCSALKDMFSIHQQKLQSTMFPVPGNTHHMFFLYVHVLYQVPLSYCCIFLSQQGKWQVGILIKCSRMAVSNGQAGLTTITPCLTEWLQEVWLDAEDVQLLNEGEEVTLMDWGNAIVQTISKSADGKTITGMHRFCAWACIHMGLVLCVTAGSNCVSCLIRERHQHLCC